MWTNRLSLATRAAAVVQVCAWATQPASAAGVLFSEDERVPAIFASRSTLSPLCTESYDALTYDAHYRNSDWRKRTTFRYVLPLPREATPKGASLRVGKKAVAVQLLTPKTAAPIVEKWVRQHRETSLMEWFGRPLVVSAPFAFPGDTEIDSRLVVRLEPQEEAGLRRLCLRLRPVVRGASNSGGPLRVRVKGSEAPDLVYSPTHLVKARREDDDTSILSLEAPPSGPPAEALLYWGSSEGPLHAAALLYAPSGEADPFFLLLMGGKEERTPAREVIFVLDISGSMRGYKVEQAKLAVLNCLTSLAPEDRFNVGLYNDRERLLAAETLPCTEPNLDSARAFIKPQWGRGLTDIAESLIKVLASFARDDQPKLVVVLTDGFATAGLTEDERLLSSVLAANEVGARFLTVGVGDKYNQYLLEELAKRTGGHHLQVAGYKELTRLLRDAWDQVAWGLWNLEAAPEDFEAFALLPDPLPELITAQPRALLGRLRGVDHGRLRLRAHTPEGPVTQHIELQPSAFDEHNAYLARLWANRRLGVVQEELWWNGYTDARAHELGSLATQYALPTEISLALRLAPTPTDREQTFARWTQARTQDAKDALALRGQAQQALLGHLAAMSRNPENLMRYHASRNWPAIYTDSSGAQHERPDIRFVAGRGFELHRGVWRDTRPAVNAPSRRCQTFSPEYFALARSDWRVAEALALGPCVVLSLRDGVVEVGP